MFLQPLPYRWLLLALSAGSLTDAAVHAVNDNALLGRSLNNAFDQADDEGGQLSAAVEVLREEHKENVTRVGVLDRLIVGKEEKDELGICHMAAYLPLTLLVGEEGTTRIRFPSLEDTTMTGFLAVMLAQQMLNEGDGSIIPELEGLPDRCPIRFTSEIMDSSSTTYAAKTTQELLQRQTENGERQACAFMGASRSTVTIPMAILTGLAGIPQLSPFSTSSQLDNKQTFPLFGRLVTSEVDLVVPLLIYLKNKGVNHLGLLHWNDEYGNAFLRSMLDQATNVHPELTIASAEIPADGATEQDYEDAMDVLAQTNFRWFFCTYGPGVDYVPSIQVAVRKGIAGTGKHVWLLNSAAGNTMLAGLQVPKDSALALATQGVGTFSSQAGRASSDPSNPSVYDKFVERLKSLNNPSDMAFFNQRLPTYDDSPDFERPQITPKSFDFAELSLFASTIFDETILLGLAACAAAAGDSDSPSLSAVTGRALYEKLLHLSFEGATGRIEIEPKTGSRLPTTAMFRISNGVQVELNETHYTYEVVDAELFTDGEWSESTPYIYNDGTTRIPDDIPPAQLDYNYVGSGTRVTGLVLAGIIFALSVFFAIWTAVKRNDRVVRASQPLFLLLICVGTLIMGSAIIPMSIDDEIASESASDVACMTTPWLASIGFNFIFCALFSKTWRVNRIFSSANFRRVTLQAKDVMAPMVVLLGCNVVVLAVWTVVAPLEWKREVESYDVFGQPTESVGSCTADDNAFLPFTIVLVVINVGALSFASYQSYQARTIALEFQESDFVGRAITCMVLVSFVGVPTMILVSDEPQARFFVSVSIIFVICISVLLFIFVPKMFYDRNNKSGIKGAIRETVHATRASHSNASGALDRSEEQGAAILNKPGEMERLISENKELRQKLQSQSTDEEQFSQEHPDETGLIVHENNDDTDENATE